MGYTIRLGKEDASVTIGDTTYRNGDEFNPPAGWKLDAEQSRFLKRPTFTYSVPRKTRNQLTGKWETVMDTKSESVPVVED